MRREFRSSRPGPPDIDQMLTPLSWIRKQRLARALVGYPVYDPPHKIEERLLSKEQAAENFYYFMAVRKARCAHFRDWLKSNFDVTIQPDDTGVLALNDWFVCYGGLLLPTPRIERSYYSYDPPWAGEGLGCNVLFDFGMTIGEFLIANCPNLHWEVGPTAPLTEKFRRKLRSTFGVSYQRPMITGYRLRRWGADPLHRVEQYADIYIGAFYTIGNWWDRVAGHRRIGKELRHYIIDHFRDRVELYRTGLPECYDQSDDYPIGDDEDE